MKKRSIDDLIVATGRPPVPRWEPPAELVSALDKAVKHNSENPNKRVSAARLSAWLAEYDVKVSKEAVRLWLLRRHEELGLP